MSQHRLWVYGDDVNTDVIFPGKYTYTLKSPQDIASVALEDLDPTFAGGVQAGDIVVGGRNWGCGSSREQAVTALKFAGVGMIIARSFNGLYFRNCINQGVQPVVLPDWDGWQTGDQVTLDREAWTLAAGDRCYDLPRLPESVQAIIDAGGLVPMLRRRFGG